MENKKYYTVGTILKQNEVKRPYVSRKNLKC